MTPQKEYTEQLMVDAMVRYLKHRGESVHYEELADLFDIGVLTVVKRLIPRAEIQLTNFGGGDKWVVHKSLLHCYNWITEDPRRPQI